MKKSLNKTILIGMTVILALGAAGAAGVYAGSAGSDQDPLVTLSYVEKRIQEVLTNVNEQIADIKKQTQNSGNSSGAASGASVFQVVQADKGSFIYFGGGTEFVVRSGKAAAITSPLGGLSDFTDGKDIGMGQNVPANHHMLVPRDDGRGLSILDTTYLLIKGPYTITQ